MRQANYCKENKLKVNPSKSKIVISSCEKVRKYPVFDFDRASIQCTSEIWGFSNIEKIEIFHRNFLRRCLKNGKSTSTCMLYGETGRRHLKCTIEKRMINYGLKIISHSYKKITKSLYNYILKLHVENIHTNAWLQRIKTILDGCGEVMCMIKSE